MLSAYWISVLSEAVPRLRTHLVSLDLPAVIPDKVHRQLRHRCMQVRRLQVFPIEAIVRGHLTGSAWKEYQAQGTVHGIKVAEGMKESESFSEPLFTPSTKAEAGGTGESGC